MNPLPQHAPPRSARISLGGGIPAVLRFSDGGREHAELRTVSLTGGLLRLPHGLEQGSSCRVMFVTHTGPVLGTAEMLGPISPNLQPFRFVSLHQTDRRKLGEAIRTCLEPDNSRLEWIEKYRAAAAREEISRQGNFKRIVTIVTGATFGLVSLLYLLHLYAR